MKSEFQRNEEKEENLLKEIIRNVDLKPVIWESVEVTEYYQFRVKIEKWERRVVAGQVLTQNEYAENQIRPREGHVAADQYLDANIRRENWMAFITVEKTRIP